jgi:hypothetical protein
MAQETGTETLWDNIIYLILLVLFLAPAFIFLMGQMNGASVWSDYYAKELTKIINLAEPGDQITINVHKATEIAQKKGLNFNEIFDFDNPNNQVCVKLSPGKSACYHFFNDVDVIEPQVKLGTPENILIFEIKEVQKEDE